MEVRLHRDKESWNRFVSNHNGPPFTSWEWGELCKLYGHEPLRLVATEDEEIQGCLSLVHVESPIFGAALVSMPYSEHGSVLLPPGNKGETARRSLLSEARTVAEDRSVEYCCLRGSRVPGTDCYLRFNTGLTFEVNTDRDRDILFQSTETRFRTAVRDAKDNQVRVNRATNPESVDEFFDLYVETMRNHGVPPHSQEFFRQMWDKLYSEDRLEIFFAFPPGNTKPISTAIVLPFENRVHYKHAASNPLGRNLNAGSLLLWKILEWASENDYAKVDLGRTRKGTGVYNFKRSLNGRELYLDDLYYYPEQFVPPLTPEQATFRPLMALWKQLPLRITTLLGPYIRRGLP